MAKKDSIDPNGERQIPGKLLKKAQDSPVKFVRALIDEAAPVLALASARWQRYRWKYRAGLRYMQGGGLPAQFPTNYIFGTVETVKTNVPRSMPSMLVHSVDVDDRIGDDLITKLLKFSLENCKLRSKIKHGALHHAAITGLGWVEITVEEDAYFGQPDNAIQCYPPEQILCDPSAIPFYGPDGRVTARYIIKWRKEVSLEEVESMFPDAKLDEGDDTEGADGEDGTMGMPDRIGSYDSRKRSSVGKVADLFECWINTFDRKKPWHRIVIWKGKLVKGPEPSPYDHPYPPLIPVYMGYDDGADDMYQAGIGEVEEIEPLQDKANMMDMDINKALKAVINRQRVVNKGLGLRAHQVDNTPGRVYEVAGSPKEAIHWDTPPMLTSDVYSYRMMVDYSIELVSGVTGTQAGRKPTGIQAAKAINQLSQNSDRRIEDKRDDLSHVYEIIGEMAVSNIFQFWTDERTVRLMDGGNIVVIGDYPTELQKPKNYDDMEPQQQDQLIQQQDEFRTQNGISLVLSDLKRNHTIQVSTDSALPEDRQERTQLVADLIRLGVIDRRAVLEALDWPDREDILQRLDAAQTGKQASDGVSPGQQQAQMQQEQMIAQQQAQAQAQAQAQPQQQPQVDPQVLQIAEALMQNPQALQMVIQLLQQGGGQPQQPSPVGDPAMMAPFMGGGPSG